MIREICESLAMKDEIKFYREIAGKTIKFTKYKFDEVTSHACRRTFCTLKFLKGMPTQAIMKFTGQTSERNFLKHLKLYLLTFEVKSLQVSGRSMVYN